MESKVVQVQTSHISLSKPSHKYNPSVCLSSSLWVVNEQSFMIFLSEICIFLREWAVNG